MVFPKSSLMWVVFFVAVLTVILLLFVYFQGGVSHVLPK
jgi:hypothetical protein